MDLWRSIDVNAAAATTKNIVGSVCAGGNTRLSAGAGDETRQETTSERVTSTDCVYNLRPLDCQHWKPVNQYTVTVFRPICLFIEEFRRIRYTK